MQQEFRTTTRYHPLLVILHWSVAVLITALLGAGLWLNGVTTSHPAKLTVLMWHMSGGMLVLVLMLVRLAVRACTAKPSAVSSGHLLLDNLRAITHLGFYVLVIGMAATGLSTAVLAGLNRIIFQRPGEPLPSDLTTYPTFIAHTSFAALLAGAIVIHVVAVIWHHLVLKDKPLTRMNLG